MNMNQSRLSGYSCKPILPGGILIYSFVQEGITHPVRNSRLIFKDNTFKFSLKKDADTSPECAISRTKTGNTDSFKCRSIHSIILWVKRSSCQIRCYLFPPDTNIITLDSIRQTGGKDTMERFLDDYINRLRPQIIRFPPETAHGIASVFLNFRFRLYANVIKESTQVISLIPEGGANGALKKALSVIRLNAQNLENSQFSPDLSIAFSEGERQYLPLILPIEQVEAPSTLELDNALVLIYSAATITSQDDEEAMAEHRPFIVRLLTGYKKALGFS
jgi:hypothetical protein